MEVLETPSLVVATEGIRRQNESDMWILVAGMDAIGGSEK
jgi:hypothetical protein